MISQSRRKEHTAHKYFINNNARYVTWSYSSKATGNVTNAAMKKYEINSVLVAYAP